MDIDNKLKELRDYAYQKHIPILQESASRVLKEWLIRTQPKKILEIGTSIGTSGILALSVAKHAYLVTIEKDEDIFLQARNNFLKFNLLARANLIHGNCFDVLMLMQDRFDFVILDGPKAHNKELVEIIFPMLVANGIIFVDNISFHNRIYEKGIIPHKHRTIIRGIRQFIKYIKSHKNMQTVFYQDGDGIAIIKKVG